ncbi:enoyl-CoA hydratase/isomerase family protein [Mycobacterium paraseoulense]|uniref:Enoyl-CoA hydratase n=1 Tax=Mycobacterium paraseoulense TaxID=590652 RepID=A0A1X0IEW6_9MYCO|nr:enoyl-CoA hydratase-related protein [Mycobacterium paraseoulense]MCV7393874.1 enoyl-CoA hydratase/isomerase family protein [Mycobacterium paraseoulense]ORB45402.1 enoyl-CoA hydratase [Mycobacterium paraseoulense]BBZ70501.1 enoyl-CoA hydratase [Mycobacterium paraseoulense]
MNAIVNDSANGVLTITLNRPEAANALRPQDRDQLIALLHNADADELIRVVVLRAAGKHFCSGADVAALAKRRDASPKRVLDPMRRIMTGAQRLVGSVLDCQKPVIAAVQGAASGLGAHLAYASDLVIATEHAYFAESFVKRGLVVDGGGCYLLPRRIGMQKAKELAFFGERLSAPDALALGLVNRVVPESEFDSTVSDFASRCATGPTSAIALTKRLLNDSPDCDRAGAFAAEAMAQEIQSHAHDSTEGVRAFVERRPTQFTGW